MSPKRAKCCIRFCHLKSKINVVGEYPHLDALLLLSAALRGVSRQHTKTASGEPESIKRGVHQLLANKVSGNLAGISLSVAEHLRLGEPGTYCGLAQEVLAPLNKTPLIVADSEHINGELIRDIHQNTSFDPLVPTRNQAAYCKQCNAIDEKQFTCHWAGTQRLSFPMKSNGRMMVRIGSLFNATENIPMNGPLRDSFQRMIETKSRH